MSKYFGIIPAINVNVLLFRIDYLFKILSGVINVSTNVNFYLNI